MKTIKYSWLLATPS